MEHNSPYVGMARFLKYQHCASIFDLQFLYVYIHVGCNQWGCAYTQLHLLRVHSGMVRLVHFGGHCGHLQSDKGWG